MNAATVARLELLHPRVKLKGQQHCQLAALKGIDLEISQGLRTWPEQAALYAQGRTTPGLIVTHAKPGQSYHQFGLAYDIALVTAGGLDWSGTDELWVEAIALGQSLGLTAGAEWHGVQQDRPHFQLTGGFGVSPGDDVLSLFHGGGINAVWAELDSFYASNGN